MLPETDETIIKINNIVEKVTGKNLMREEDPDKALPWVLLALVKLDERVKELEHKGQKVR
jgi:hypothetical protein